MHLDTPDDDPFGADRDAREAQDAAAEDAAHNETMDTAVGLRDRLQEVFSGRGLSAEMRPDANGRVVVTLDASAVDELIFALRGSSR